MCDETGRMCTYIYVVVLVNAISTKTSRKSFPRQPGSCCCNGRPTGKFWHPSGHRRTVLGPAEEESFPVPHQVSLVHHPWYERHHRAGVQFQTVTSLTCCFCFFVFIEDHLTVQGEKDIEVHLDMLLMCCYYGFRTTKSHLKWILSNSGWL